MSSDDEAGRLIDKREGTMLKYIACITWRASGNSLDPVSCRISEKAARCSPGFKLSSHDQDIDIVCTWVKRSTEAHGRVS